ncbi:unnamed protein product [Urochloa humidicola]
MLGLLSLIRANNTIRKRFLQSLLSEHAEDHMLIFVQEKIHQKQSVVLKATQERCKFRAIHAVGRAPRPDRILFWCKYCIIEW